MSWQDRLQRAWTSNDALAQALRPFGALHAALLRLRVWTYRAGLKKSLPLPCPVIVVGNWIVGGAGKTPATLALLDVLGKQGWRAGVVSRGYGRRDDSRTLLVQPDSAAAEVGDEPLLIHLRGRCPVAVGRDRIAAAQALLAAYPALDLIVADDGLQHWRLPRQLSIVVIDDRGLGNGRLLPAGPLRQAGPLPAPPGSRDDTLLLYSGGKPSTPLPGYVGTRRLAGAVRLQEWWQGQPARPEALTALRGRPVLAAAGLARPQAFFDMLTAQGLDIRPLPLPDHHDFTTLPWPADCIELLLTEKDAVKLPPSRVGQTQVWVVALDFRPEFAFEQALCDRVQALLR
ncbi:tetraacyldisaccharide 4'-kinase [Mitsuaria sp. WAJ17]|uniref:tetraacyldisaccharide 4'-kinase n=1 Tax=Mitsuaria sp. WAJ17 TaxID=2761452 RepID=UPI001602CDFB|nr:tetraacyldisaccharide 4'-kinase [Mitsuaria sp. WAJ17]MBB2485454.1 tetraacyldisaccharide 4'-kinase [Mitsuaria sp. WAJ17]